MRYSESLSFALVLGPSNGKCPEYLILVLQQDMEYGPQFDGEMSSYLYLYLDLDLYIYPYLYEYLYLHLLGPSRKRR